MKKVADLACHPAWPGTRPRSAEALCLPQLRHLMLPSCPLTPKPTLGSWESMLGSLGHDWGSWESTLDSWGSMLGLQVCILGLQVRILGSEGSIAGCAGCRLGLWGCI